MSFAILKFWTTYTPDGVDEAGQPKMKAVDMVAYSPIGKSQMQVSIDAVSRLAKVQPVVAHMDNPAVIMANNRWETIKRHYDAWKAGNEAPEVGVPLAAWPGVSPEQAQLLKNMGIRSVEQVRDASDGIVSRFPFPNARELQKSAATYLASFDKDKIGRDMKRLEDQNAEKDAQLEELRQMVLELQAQGKQGRKEKAAA